MLTQGSRRVGVLLLVVSLVLVAIGVYCVVRGWPLAAAVFAGGGIFNATQIVWTFRRYG